jgi:prepilin peptidase CpaA
MIPMVVFVFLSFQLLLVAYIDFKYKKISNFWILINFLFFCLLTWVFPQIYLWNIKTVIFPIAFLFVGVLLFALHIMGGGDSKYLSSFYLLVPVGFQDTVFLYLLYTTIIIGSSLLLFNVLKNFDRIIALVTVGNIAGIKKIFGKKFTFAPVVFVAWMWFGWQNYSHIKF